MEVSLLKKGVNGLTEVVPNYVYNCTIYTYVRWAHCPKNYLNFSLARIEQMQRNIWHRYQTNVFESAPSVTGKVFKEIQITFLTVQSLSLKGPC